MKKIVEAFKAGYNSLSFLSERKEIHAAYEAGKSASEENRILGDPNPEYYLTEFLKTIKAN